MRVAGTTSGVDLVYWARQTRWTAAGLVRWSLVLAGPGVLLATEAEAQTVLNVASGSDLVAALTTVDTNPGTSYRINFSKAVTLNADAILPAINTVSPLVISGNNLTLNGGGVQRGFLVYSGTVAINDLAITGTQAVGGLGGEAVGGSGGGGLGAGGALFVASGGHVTVSNVQFANNNAMGGAGNGASVGGTTSGGGGGGLGGAGGGVVGIDNETNAGKGGGGVGIGAVGGNYGGGAAGIRPGCRRRGSRGRWQSWRSQRRRRRGRRRHQRRRRRRGRLCRGRRGRGPGRLWRRRRRRLVAI